MNTKFLTKRLAVSAVMIALASVLSVLAVFKLPNGGSVTVASMVPVIILSIIYGTKYGIFSAFAFSLLQMLLGGIASPPTESFLSYFLVIALDYVIAFTVLGFAGMIYNLGGRKKYMIPLSGGIVVVLRFICHFLSGVIIWDVYAPEGQPVWLYSLTYNGSYMGVELIITVAVLVLLANIIKSLDEKMYKI